MHKSSGYFRGLDCPFYLSGLCERPFCHFRHVASREKEAILLKSATSAASNNTMGYNTLAKEEYPPNIRDLSEMGEKLLAEDVHIESYTTSKANVTKSSVQHPSYQPTPISQLASTTGGSKNKRPTSRDELVTSKCSRNVTTLEYRPTPINKLKAMKSGLSDTGLNKYSTRYMPPGVSDMEYDPQFNYATTPRKRTHSPDSNISVDLESKCPKFHEEEEVEATFSDDDADGTGEGPVEMQEQVGSFYGSDPVETDDDKEMEIALTTQGEIERATSYHRLAGGQQESNQQVGVKQTDTKVHIQPSIVKPTDGDMTTSTTQVGQVMSDRNDLKKRECVTKDKSVTKEMVTNEIVLIDEKSIKLERCSDNVVTKQTPNSDKIAKHDKDRKVDRTKHKSGDVVKTNSSCQLPDNNEILKSSSHSHRKEEKNRIHENKEKLKHVTDTKLSKSSQNSSHKSSRFKDASIGHKNHKTTEKREQTISDDNLACKDTKASGDSISNKTEQCIENTDKSNKSDIKFKSNSSAATSKKHKGEKKIVSESEKSIKNHSIDEPKLSKNYQSCDHLNKTDKHLKETKFSDKCAVKTSSHDAQRHDKTSKHRSSSEHQSQKTETRKEHIHKKSADGKISSGSKDRISSSKRKSSDDQSASKNTSDENHASSSTKSCDEVKRHKERSSTSSNRSSEKLNKHNKDVRSSKSKHSRGIASNDLETAASSNITELFGVDSDDCFAEDTDRDNEDIMAHFDDLPDFMYDNDETIEQCKRIFYETQTKKTPSATQKVQKADEKPTEMVSGKQRVAHVATAESRNKMIMERPHSQLTPGQVMHNRFLHMQQKAMSNVQTAKNMGADKIRIALAAKRVANATSSNLGMTNRHNSGPTIVGTASRFEKRIAHTSVMASLPRPTIPVEFGSKVPTNIRQRYLHLIIDECLKICPTETEAYERGLHEEQSVYKRSLNRNIYLNVSVITIKRLRSEVQAPATGGMTLPSSIFTLSHSDILGGVAATKVTYTVKRSSQKHVIVNDFHGAELYKRLCPYMLSEEQLKQNNFPRPDPENPGVVKLYNGKRSLSKGNEKICLRCGKRFLVYPNYKYGMREECVYHWGKAWKKKIAGAIESQFNCCSSDMDSKGCQVCKLHVHDSNIRENLVGFMKTMETSQLPHDGNYGIYAMDCEMVYTFAGIELARVTVVNSHCKAVYETLVKPDRKVIDYNTRFSGITSNDLDGVSTTLRDVQAVLLSLFSNKTIVVGHSLESDLLAVKLIHNTVVDTSVMFPHRLGPPYKRALRNLMSDHLMKIIQNDAGGHDSQEDAAACVELLQWRLKDDVKMGHSSPG